VDDDLARQRTLTPPAPPDTAGPFVPGDAAVAAAQADGAVSGAHPDEPAGPAGQAPNGSGATGSQLRRFIKSRPWVPMHELRRRFGIEGTEDEMAGVDVGGVRIFVGLPPREAGLLADLIRQGEVGYELVHDPDCPAVAGVYPMRPVVRT
jgi:hypothetical protein